MASEREFISPEMERGDLLQRYQACAIRIWKLFPHDPLPDDDPAHFWIERLESILDRGLIIPPTGE